MDTVKRQWLSGLFCRVVYLLAEWFTLQSCFVTILSSVMLQDHRYIYALTLYYRTSNSCEKYHKSVLSRVRICNMMILYKNRKYITTNKSGG